MKTVYTSYSIYKTTAHFCIFFDFCEKKPPLLEALGSSLLRL
jgi:hypothetical protein